MDQSWMNLPRISCEYKVGLEAFLDDYFCKGAVGDQVLCPCKKCKRRYCYRRDDVRDHLIVDGFVKGFKEWTHQMEQFNLRYARHTGNRQGNDDGLNPSENIHGSLHDTSRDAVEGLDEQKVLQEHWKDPTVQKTRAKSFEVCEEQNNMHRTGSVSFARKYHEKRMKEFDVVQETGLSDSDPCDKIMVKKEHPGREVCNTQLKQKGVGKAQVQAAESIDAIKASIALDIRKELDAHKQMIIELQVKKEKLSKLLDAERAKVTNMQKELDAQKAKMDDILCNVLAQLQKMIPSINPEMIAEAIASSLLSVSEIR